MLVLSVCLQILPKHENLLIKPRVFPSNGKPSILVLALGLGVNGVWLLLEGFALRSPQSIWQPGLSSSILTMLPSGSGLVKAWPVPRGILGLKRVFLRAWCRAAFFRLAMCETLWKWLMALLASVRRLWAASLPAGKLRSEKADCLQLHTPFFLKVVVQPSLL